jgi:hypothetical protein
MSDVKEDRKESIKWIANARVDKYDGPDADARALTGDAPDDSIEVLGNLLTTAGLTRMTALLTGAAGTALTNTTARIGVGDAATAATVADTDLGAVAGSTHRQFEIMAATYPTVAAGVITFRAVFTTGEANFHWQEWGIDIGAATVAAGTTVGACLLNHKVTDLGTKTSASAWTFTVTVTLA